MSIFITFPFIFFVEKCIHEAGIMERPANSIQKLFFVGVEYVEQFANDTRCTGVKQPVISTRYQPEERHISISVAAMKELRASIIIARKTSDVCR